MAFVLHQTWDAERALPAHAASSPLAPLLAAGGDRRARRLLAILLSCAVHVLLIWMLLNKLNAGTEGEGGGSGAGRGALMQFDLSDAGSPPAAAEAPAAAQPEAAVTADTSIVDATAAGPLPPPEWTVSRLPPAAQPRQPQPPASAAGAPAGGAGQASGAGQGGSGVYDPFAGAAPLRREEHAAAPSLGERVLGFFGLGQANSGGLMLDDAALESVRRAVVQALPGRRGTAEIVVRVSPTGMVLEINARGGSAPPEARDAMARALIGKRLFRGSAVEPQLIALPALSLS